MHDIKWIRDNPDAFDRGLARRGLEPQATSILALDKNRRDAIQRAEQAQARRKKASAECFQAQKKNDVPTAAALMAEVEQLKDKISALEGEAKGYGEDLLGPIGVLAKIPNLPAPDVPDGPDETANVEHHHYGAKRNYPFQPKQHFELGEQLGQMDFELAAKLSGARFVVLKSGLARMERAIGQFFVDVHTTDHGYTEIAPPLIVRSDVMFGTAQLPKFEDDQFYGLSVNPVKKMLEGSRKIRNSLDGYTSTFVDLQESERKVIEEIKKLTPNELIEHRSEIEAFIDRVSSQGKEAGEAFEIISKAIADEYEAFGKEQRWLIPTAEVPLTNLVRESIVDEAELPLRYTAYTPCFRAEAGAAGKDTRGMIRQHQFNKVELVSITTPEESKNEHERMLACAEEVLRRLGLHYRVVTLCTGDMGFASQKTYDIEVWLPGQGMYREISSCSNCGDFQARRMDARCRPKGGSPRFVHTLNGSGVAVGRALVAVMENYQDEGGRIAVPDVLQGYMGGKKVIEKIS
jgi:seryl-tRNA synthetase